MKKNLNKAIKIISFLPFTRMIALTGSYAEGRSNDESDIDLFIQVKEGTIWSTRLAITIAISLAGIRRTDNKIRDQICLNWFATFNAPLAQEGRVFQILWQQNLHQNPKSVGKLKPILEFLILPLLIIGLEKFLKYWQIKRILADERTHQIGSAVRFSDQELGFHPLKK